MASAAISDVPLPGPVPSAKIACFIGTGKVLQILCTGFYRYVTRTRGTEIGYGGKSEGNGTKGKPCQASRKIHVRP